jgi:hypothetical protein
MGFDAGTVIEPLDWDFTEWNLGKGTIPEPSEERVIKFQKKLQAVMIRVAQEAQPPEEEADADPDRDRSRDWLRELERAQASGIAEEIAHEIDLIYGRFCQDQPSAETIGKLPYRVKVAFFRWLQEELRPEASSAVGTLRPNLSLVSNNGA